MLWGWYDVTSDIALYAACREDAVLLPGFPELVSEVEGFLKSLADTGGADLEDSILDDESGFFDLDDLA